MPTTPFLQLDHHRLERNLHRGQNLAAAAGVALRPHAKTHKCAAIAHRQIELGAKGITVATLLEAEAFSAAGVSDIFIARQVVGTEDLERLKRLSDLARICVAADHPDHINALKALPHDQKRRISVCLELDTGHHRCGLFSHHDLQALAETTVKTGLDFAGIFTHAGHAYGASSPGMIRDIVQQEAEAVRKAAAYLGEQGFPCRTISIGSTPTLFTGGIPEGVTEIRPGNYVFFDAMQMALGTATIEDCALTVGTRVIGRYPDRLVIDAGSKALGLDKGAHGLQTVSGHGHIIGHPDWIIDRLSEEHGIIRLPKDADGLLPGTLLFIIPNHACAVANLFGGFHLSESTNTTFLPTIGRR